MTRLDSMPSQIFYYTTKAQYGFSKVTVARENLFVFSPFRPTCSPEDGKG